MNKLRVIMLCCILCLTGCTNNKTKDEYNEKTIVWWVDIKSMESSVWYHDEAYKNDEEIKNAYTDKLNEILKDRGFPYHVQFKIMDVDSSFDSENFTQDVTHTSLQTLADQEAQIDLFDSTTNNYEDMADLDAYLHESYAKDFYSSMPVSYWETQRVNGISKYIPRIALYAYQNAYIIDNELAENSAINVSAIQSKEELTEAMQTVYDDQHGNIIPFSYQDLEQMDVYTNMYYPLPLPVGNYLRYQHTKGGWDVVNLNETKAFSDTMSWIEQLNQKNLTGANLKQSEYEQQMQKGTFVTTGRYYPAQLQKHVQRYAGKTQIPFGKVQAIRMGGTAVYKDSQYKKEAVQLLSLINTDKELSELFIYGLEGTDYEKRDGLVYALHDNSLPDTISGRGFAGNYLIITPSEAMGMDGQKEIRAYMEHTPVVSIDGFYPQLSEDDQKLLAQYYSQDTGIPYYQSKGTVEQLDAINQQIKKTELNRIINDIQKQLDEYLKRE